MDLSGTVVGARYRISERIGGGAFGEIYHGVDIETLNEVALKTERLSSKCPQLKYESKVYIALAGGPGVPRIHWFGTTRRHCVMAIDLLGKSLEDLLVLCGHRFSLKTVLMLADQMISCVEFLHEKSYLHRDLKPENFLMGANANSNLVYLIDYGLAKYYRDPRTHIHTPYQDGRGLTGTARYASVNSLSGIEQSRRDDMEALGYIWVYFLNGKLPWMGVKGVDSKQRCRAIREMKERVRFEELCEGLPPEFVRYFFLVRQMRFSDKPNYEVLRGMLREAFIREGFVHDYKFDWVDQIPSFDVVKGEEAMEKPRISMRSNSQMLIASSDLFPLPVKPTIEEEEQPRSVKKQIKPLSRLARLAVSGGAKNSSPRRARAPAPSGR